MAKVLRNGKIDRVEGHAQADDVPVGAVELPQLATTTIRSGGAGRSSVYRRSAGALEASR